jgi:hypothetical protein
MYFYILNNIHQHKSKYGRDPVLVCIFNEELSARIGDREVYISEFVIAKILGYIKHLNSHPEVTIDFLINLPKFLNNPAEILIRADRPKERYVICGTPQHRIVLEIKRSGGLTQINTIHAIKESKLKRLRNKCKNL